MKKIDADKDNKEKFPFLISICVNLLHLRMIVLKFHPFSFDSSTDGSRPGVSPSCSHANRRDWGDGLSRPLHRPAIGLGRPHLPLLAPADERLGRI
jgi:hypothetical protein